MITVSRGSDLSKDYFEIFNYLISTDTDSKDDSIFASMIYAGVLAKTNTMIDNFRIQANRMLSASEFILKLIETIPAIYNLPVSFGLRNAYNAIKEELGYEITSYDCSLDTYQTWHYIIIRSLYKDVTHITDVKEVIFAVLFVRKLSMDEKYRRLCNLIQNRTDIDKLIDRLVRCNEMITDLKSKSHEQELDVINSVHRDLISCTDLQYYIDNNVSSLSVIEDCNTHKYDTIDNNIKRFYKSIFEKIDIVENIWKLYN